MFKKINFNLAKEKKIYNIKIYNKLIILISGVLIASSLIIGWFLLIIIGKEELGNYIKWLNDQQKNNFNFKINLNKIKIILFFISSFYLLLTILFFIFAKIKNSFSAFFCLIIFIFSAIFIIFSIIFLIFKFKIFIFLNNQNKNKIIKINTKFIILFLPWILAKIFSLILLIQSISLAINITSKYRLNSFLIFIDKKNKNKIEIIEKKTSYDKINIPTIIEIKQNLKTENRLIKNNKNNWFKLKNNKINNNFLTKNINYTNNEILKIPFTKKHYNKNILSKLNIFNNFKKEIENNKINKTISESEIEKKKNLIKSKIEKNINNNKDDNKIKKENNINLNNNCLKLKLFVFFKKKSKNNNQKVHLINKQEKMQKNIEKKTKIKIENTYNWTLEQIEAVWKKGEIINKVSDKLYRKDYAGAWMYRNSFTANYNEANNLETYSWTIVLHRPNNQKGTKELSNLDPMNIINAKSKNNNYPFWKTKISSKGNKNIEKEQNWKARN